MNSSGCEGKSTTCLLAWLGWAIKMGTITVVATSLSRARSFFTYTFLSSCLGVGRNDAPCDCHITRIPTQWWSYWDSAGLRSSTVEHLYERERGTTQQCNLGEPLLQACFRSASEQEACLRTPLFSPTFGEIRDYGEVYQARMAPVGIKSWLRSTILEFYIVNLGFETLILPIELHTTSSSFAVHSRIGREEPQQKSATSLVTPRLQESPTFLLEEDPSDFPTLRRCTKTKWRKFSKITPAW